MTYIKYIILAIASLISVFFAYFLNYWACRHLDAEGNLIYLRGWLQPPDMAELWGPDWDAARAGLTKSQAVLMYLKRNPGQGFDQLIKANVTRETAVKCYGNLDISDGVYGAPIGGWFFITGGGVFQFPAIIPTRFFCIDIGLGWRPEPIAKKYETKTLGALIATPMRFFRLKK